jgi:hypothetical protein
MSRWMMLASGRPLENRHVLAGLVNYSSRSQTKRAEIQGFALDQADVPLFLHFAGRARVPDPTPQTIRWYEQSPVRTLPV